MMEGEGMDRGGGESISSFIILATIGYKTTKKRYVIKEERA
jgi:hypothetical protein